LITVGLRERESFKGALHAFSERRAVFGRSSRYTQAAYYGIPLAGATLYTTISPCIICAKMIINAGIIRIHFREGYMDQLAKDMLKEAEIEVSQS
jgi:dCMP deaminase